MTVPLTLYTWASSGLILSQPKPAGQRWRCALGSLGPAHSICSSPLLPRSPNLLASGGADGELCIWDVGNPLQPSLYPAMQGGAGACCAVLCCPCCGFVLLCCAAVLLTLHRAALLLPRLVAAVVVCSSSALPAVKHAGCTAAATCSRCCCQDARTPSACNPPTETCLRPLFVWAAFLQLVPSRRLPTWPGTARCSTSWAPARRRAQVRGAGNGLRLCCWWRGVLLVLLPATCAAVLSAAAAAAAARQMNQCLPFHHVLTAQWWCGT